MNRKSAILLALVLLFCFSLWYCIQALLSEIPVEKESAGQTQAVAKTEEEKVTAKGIDYNAIVEKNIFHPERKFVDKPPPSALQSPLVPPPVMPSLALKGIVQGGDNEFIAYLSIDGKKAQPIRVGDRIDDIKVVSITMTDVTIRWFTTDVKLTLSKVKSMGTKR